MTTSIFVNLPVSDLEASKAFYTALGYSINPNFTDETAACVVFSDTIYAMLLTHAKFSRVHQAAHRGHPKFDGGNSRHFCRQP